MDFSATAEKLIRTAPQIRSQGACGAFYWGNCKPIAGSHAVETMGWISSYLSRRPLPRSGGGGRGCGAERRQWRMQRGGAPQGGWGRCCRRLPLEHICAQCGFRFFDREKSKSVASTAKRQRGLQRGKPGSPLPCFASFCRSKRKAPAASGDNYAFAKGPATPPGDYRP